MAKLGEIARRPRRIVPPDAPGGSCERGQITGDLLVAEFSNGDDVLLLDRASDGSISQVRQLDVGFNNPLDVAVNSANGDVYVAEYGDQASGAGAQITVLQPSNTSTTPVFRVNFQPAASVVPSGYAVDSGQAYSTSRGYGWIAQSSSTPQSMETFTRERNVVLDQRLDTFIHIQPTSGAAGRWEHDVPNGHYVVTLAVGDPSYTDSLHRLTVEGVVAVDNFMPTSSQKQLTRTVEVDVSDGKMTLDAAGGTNTKIDYIDVDTTAGDPGPGADGADITVVSPSSSAVRSSTARAEPTSSPTTLPPTPGAT